MSFKWLNNSKTNRKRRNTMPRINVPHSNHYTRNGHNFSENQNQQTTDATPGAEEMPETSSRPNRRSRGAVIGAIVGLMADGPGAGIVCGVIGYVIENFCISKE
jgi:hypothetical protein